MQPYFPPQIVFTTDDDYTIAIDEINQQAYQKLYYSSSEQQTSFVMKHFPYTTPDTPESKYYVQLSFSSSSPTPSSCQYVAYWKYTTQYFNQFPVHWWVNESTFEIKNYMDFSYKMIHSQNSSIDEDYWYANEQCRTESAEIFPCQEIFFKKNTQIPLRYTEVVRHGMQVVQEVTNYQVLSIGKPDEKYFDSIPKNWSNICQDFNLGITCDPQEISIRLNHSSNIHISLTAPPHQIHGNDTLRIRWKETESKDCFKWSPEELYFNSTNFQKQQILTLTRVKNGPLTKILPIFHGGGFDHLSSDDYAITIT